MSKAITAIYPGTFDPPTNGHLDVIARGAKIVDQLVVAVLRNASKGVPLFTVNEREQMLREATAHISNVTVETFDGLLVDFARATGAKAVIRGIRAVSDYEYEFQMAMMNRKLDPELETLFMMPAEKYTYVSSRLIKGVFQLGGDVSSLVPPVVVERLKKKKVIGAAVPGRSSVTVQEQFGQIDIYVFDQILRGNIAAGMKVLDAGCGYGRNLVYLLREGCEVYALDASPEGVEHVRALAAELNPKLPPENFQVGEIEAMPFADGFADVVMCSSVLHFARDQHQFLSMLEELWRVLRPGRAAVCAHGVKDRDGL